MGGVEFQGPKLPTVVRRPRALRVLFWVHRPAPVSDGPHRAPGPHRRRAILLASGNNVGKTEAGRWRGVGPIQAFRCGIEFAKLHPRSYNARHRQSMSKRLQTLRRGSESKGVLRCMNWGCGSCGDWWREVAGVCPPCRWEWPALDDAPSTAVAGRGAHRLRSRGAWGFVCVMARATRRTIRMYSTPWDRPVPAPMQWSIG